MGREDPVVASNSREESTRSIEGDLPVLQVAIVGIDLDSTSIDNLETVAREVTPEWVERVWSTTPGTEEVAVLRTCHRVELVLLVRSPEAIGSWQDVLPGPPGAWSLRRDREAVLHLHRVSAGLESLAVGEREVREQVRRAVHTVRSRYPRPVLREVLTSAVEAAATTSPHVPAPRSIAAIAASRLLEEVARPFPRVVVIGAGVVGRQLAEALGSYARVTLLYRSAPPAEEFLRSTGARAASVDHLAEEIPLSDVVVTAAKSAGRILRVDDLGDPPGPLLIIDLGVPRNVDPGVRTHPRVRLLDLEDLRSDTTRPADIGPLELRVAELAQRSWLRLERALLEPWVDALWRHGEAVRSSELATALPFLGPLTSEQQEAVERLTRRLVTSLLRGPAERVRALPSGPEGDRLRRFALELYHIDPDAP
jgi:glutamyl-tRNA reductase